MNQLDVYYRALRELRLSTEANRDSARLNRAFAEADADADRVEVTRTVCTVEEDWVRAIEEGLVHVEKAIKQERQFIYSNGEVIPIEKVKHTSRESVQHLAKHSELLTKYVEGEDIVPDKLYTVERDNDYAVYENRFLYMLLCYLRDFITVRYNEILDLTNRYDGTLEIDKEIVAPKQTVCYRVELHEVRRDDAYLREHNAAKDMIDRIDLILKTVLAFLSTPLMECAAKVAMLKPPITKTNVLKMNNDFKGAVALYDFIISYDKKGYTVEKQTRTLSPFEGDMAQEIAEAGTLLSFLTYEYGLDIRSDLRKSFDREEQRRRNEETQKRSEQLEALRRRIAKSGESPEEYMLLLEKQLRALQNECAKLEPLTRELEALRETEQLQRQEIRELGQRIDQLKADMLASEQAHIREMEAQREAHETQMRELAERYEQELRAQREAHLAEMETWRRSVDEIKAAHAEALAAEASRRTEIEAAYAELAAGQAALEEAKRLAEARLKGLRAERGEMTDAGTFTDKESFDELEREYEAFVRFYKKEWQSTRRAIRKRMLKLENFKEQDGESRRSDE